MRSSVPGPETGRSQCDPGTPSFRPSYSIDHGSMCCIERRMITIRLPRLKIILEHAIAAGLVFRCRDE